MTRPHDPLAGSLATAERAPQHRLRRAVSPPSIPPRVAAFHVRMWVLALVTVVAVGTAGYIVIGGWSLSDALYMTVITATTTGIREVRDLDDAGRTWTMLISVAGVALIFGFVGIVGESIVVEATSGKREASRMRQAVEALRDHFVLCGFGRVGSTVAHHLRQAGQPLVVLDILPDSLERARRQGFLVVEGDATEDVTLRAAGIERARGLITTIDSDALNVYVILSARALNPEMLIVGRATTSGAEAKLTQAGADRVVSPYTMAGRRLAELAVRPRVVDFIDAALEHGDLAFALEEAEVAPGGPLAGRSVGELRSAGIFVLAIVRSGGDYEPQPSDARVLAPGETLIASGSVDALAALRTRASAAPYTGSG